MRKPTVIAISLGDVNGIGPEVALRATLQKRWPAPVRFVLVGSASLAAQQAEALGLTPPPAWNPGERTPRSRVTVWTPGSTPRLRCQPGRVSATAGQAAANWITAAVEGCRERHFQALVTAPICKEALHRAGLTVPGHTELLAALTRTRRFAMMLMGGALRVVLVTRHLPLAEVPGALTRAEITKAIELTGEALPWLGYRKPRIGVCALNPHAGEGGDLGTEESRLIAPAIKAAIRKGHRAVGPIPSDVIFHQALRGEYDAVVAMYHDQGLGPLKMLAFEKGINITLGLPLVRTSPDHGTAFDIAGKGRANPSSMVEALKLAIRLAHKRNPWGK
jgi:4-hydroxythreonine-4-phosphate dehydrogenase